MKRLLPIALAVGLLASATPAMARTAPLTTNPHSAAGALARGTALARSFPLPAGVAWTTKVTKRPDLVQDSQTVVVSRVARGTYAAPGLVRFFVTHPVAGTVASVPVQISAGETALTYETKTATNTEADLQLTVHGAKVQLELDVSVGWAPLRPADTLLPTTSTAVTVEVWPPQNLPGPAVPTFPHQVIHATGPAVASLVRYFNGLKVQGPFPRGGGACSEPLFYGSAPRFTFRTPHHVVVFQYVDNCQTFNVSVDGKHRPTFSALSTRPDPTRLVMTRLLHLVP